MTNWIHTTITFEQEGREDLVCEGNHKEGTIDWGEMDMILSAQMSGWRIKDKSVDTNKRTSRAG